MVVEIIVLNHKKIKLRLKIIRKTEIVFAIIKGIKFWFNESSRWGRIHIVGLV
jgi:hypothetical protein